jgi:hypothetical protein
MGTEGAHRGVGNDPKLPFEPSLTTVCLSTLVRNHMKHFLYSTMASRPKAKNATKMNVEAGTIHQRAYSLETIIGGVNAAGYRSMREKLEWTSDHEVHGRRGTAKMVYQRV